MDSPIKAATSAFSLSFMIRLLVGIILVNAAVAFIAGYFPRFAQIFYNPLSFIQGNGPGG